MIPARPRHCPTNSRWQRTGLFGVRGERLWSGAAVDRSPLRSCRRATAAARRRRPRRGGRVRVEGSGLRPGDELGEVVEERRLDVHFERLRLRAKNARQQRRRAARQDTPSRGPVLELPYRSKEGAAAELDGRREIEFLVAVVQEVLADERQLPTRHAPGSPLEDRAPRRRARPGQAGARRSAGTRRRRTRVARSSCERSVARCDGSLASKIPPVGSVLPASNERSLCVATHSCRELASSTPAARSYRLRRRRVRVQLVVENELRLPGSRRSSWLRSES